MIVRAQSKPLVSGSLVIPHVSLASDRCSLSGGRRLLVSGLLTAYLKRRLDFGGLHDMSLWIFIQGSLVDYGSDTEAPQIGGIVLVEAF